MRAIDADALIADCRLAQKQADRSEREFSNAFYSGGGEVSTEWWFVEDMIENAPTIEPERKTGEWIIRDNPGTGWFRVTCSECGEDVTSVIPLIGFFPDCKALWNYCPDCGADMRYER